MFIRNIIYFAKYSAKYFAKYFAEYSKPVNSILELFLTLFKRSVKIYESRQKNTLPERFEFIKENTDYKEKINSAHL